MASSARTGLAGRSSRANTPLVFDFKYDGPGLGKGGTGVLSVDGKEMAQKTIKHTIPLHDDHRRDLRRRGRYPHGGG